MKSSAQMNLKNNLKSISIRTMTGWLVMLLTIPLSATVLQGCNQKPVTVEKIAPEYKGLLTGVTLTNAKVANNGVELLKENVLITTSFKQVQVDGTFVFKNPGGKTSLKMGIPLRIPSTSPRKEDAERKLDIETRDVKVLVDGKTVPVKAEEVSSVEEVAMVALGGTENTKTRPQRILTPWQTWNVDLDKNQQATVKVLYTENYDKRAKLGRDDKEIDPIQVYYISNNGKWEGKPERQVSFKLKEISKDLLAPSVSTPTSQTGNDINYKLPDDGSESFVSIEFRENIKNKDIIKAIQAKLNTAKNKDLYVAKLVKEYDNRKMYKEKQELYLSYLTKAKDKLSEQLLSLSAEKIFEEVVKDLSELKDKSQAKKLAGDMVPILKKQIELNSKPVAITFQKAQQRREKVLNDWLEVCQKTM